ncbi:MAG: DeoR/GlpR family DNA-binding transcription regulator [Anaerolineae bacterium]|nr:DeoR/GlpR family DNA-binding transcription regulator [Anaerolineae bacterium]
MRDAAPRKFLPEERLAHIADLVAEQHAVSVAELSERFSVSAATIRADLDELERRGLILRTHGGAVRVDRNGREFSFQVREQAQVEEKRRIGAAAAEMVADGDAIALDASTTALQIARRLRGRRELTVVTSSLMVAMVLCNSPGVTVVMPGGVLDPNTISLVGALGTDTLSKCNAGKGFFGVRGLTLDGLTDVNSYEVELKRSLISASREVNIVADSSKWGRVALVSLVSWSAVHRVISDRGAPADMVEALRARGIEVLLV